MCVHPLQVVVLLCTLLYSTVQSTVVRYHLPPPLPPPVSSSSCLFTRCHPLYTSYCTVLLDFSRYCKILNVFFIFCVCLLCIICVKSIINLSQYYMADCVSWVPRLTLLDLWTNWTYERALRRELVRIQGTSCTFLFPESGRKGPAFSVSSATNEFRQLDPAQLLQACRLSWKTRAISIDHWLSERGPEPPAVAASPRRDWSEVQSLGPRATPNWMGDSGAGAQRSALTSLPSKWSCYTPSLRTTGLADFPSFFIVL